MARKKDTSERPCPKCMLPKSMKDAPPEKRESKTYSSSVPFDHYNVPLGKAITDTEFPVGKRTKPPPLGDDQK